MLCGLDLFSGIGGITLALAPWSKPVAYCESDEYAQRILLNQQRLGNLPVAPIWDDVRSLRGTMLPGIDIIYGGFPCQDISLAGLGKGLEGERSGLFFEIIRLVREIRPRFVFLENVPAVTTRGLDRIAQEFSALRYDSRWGMLSAYDVGAPHKRERWFFLANADSKGLEGYDSPTGKSKKSKPRHCDWWATEPDVGRVVNGLPFRVDRLRCLGNAVVPTQAREAFRRLAGLP